MPSRSSVIRSATVSAVALASVALPSAAVAGELCKDPCLDPGGPGGQPEIAPPQHLLELHDDAGTGGGLSTAFAKVTVYAPEPGRAVEKVEFLDGDGIVPGGGVAYAFAKVT